MNIVGQTIRIVHQLCATAETFDLRCEQEKTASLCEIPYFHPFPMVGHKSSHHEDMENIYIEIQP